MELKTEEKIFSYRSSDRPALEILIGLTVLPRFVKRFVMTPSCYFIETTHGLACLGCQQLFWQRSRPEHKT